jgi:hypothetical protein
MLEDVLKIEEVLRVIIEAKGAVMPDELYRIGWRWRRAYDKSDCEHKPAKRQRKDANDASPYHPSLAATYELLLNPPRAQG